MRRLWIGLTALLIVLGVGGLIATQEIDYLPGAEERVGRYLFLVDDLNEPLPGSGVTARDLRRRGLLLFDSVEALEEQISSDVCMIGTIGVVEEGRGANYPLPRVPGGGVHLHWGRDLGARWILAWDPVGQARVSNKLERESFFALLEDYSCDYIESMRAELASERELTENALRMLVQQTSPSRGHGGLFVVDDISNPIPGAPYTPEDFAAAGIHLFTWDEFDERVRDLDLCMVGGYAEGLRNDLFAGIPRVFVVNLRNLEYKYGGPEILKLDMLMGFGDLRFPSLEVAPNEWRPLTSIMEAMGCTPEQTEEASEPIVTFDTSPTEYLLVDVEPREVEMPIVADLLPGAEERLGRFLFLVEDIDDPLPGSGITGEDFTRRGFLLFDSLEALEAHVNRNVCWIGTIGVVEPRLQHLPRVPGDAYEFHVTKELVSWGGGISLGMSKATPFNLEYLDRTVHDWSCEVIEDVREWVADVRLRAEEVMLQSLGYLGPPTGSGAVFLTRDIDDPIPGTPYTAEDFAAAGIRLVTSDEALIDAVEQGVCMIGGSVSDLEWLLRRSSYLFPVIEKNIRLFAVDPESQEYVAGGFLQVIGMITRPNQIINFAFPSFEVEAGKWRTLTSIVETMGCTM